MLINKIRTKQNLEIKVELLEIKNIANDKKDSRYELSTAMQSQIKGES